MTNRKTYKELSRLKTFDERFAYLRLNGLVCEERFGYDRYLNQGLYSSKEWASVRQRVIIRDNGCDLGIDEYPLYSRIYVHHINPITLEDLENESGLLFDMDNLICTSFDTHQAIHYGKESILQKNPVERFSGDTFPWKRIGEEVRVGDK